MPKPDFVGRKALAGKLRPQRYDLSFDLTSLGCN